MSLYYLDTSAALKLLAEESNSTAFASFYDAHTSSSWVSSALLRIEVIRAVTRALPAALPPLATCCLRSITSPSTTRSWTPP